MSRNTRPAPAEVLKDTEAIIRRFVALGDDEALIVATWTLHTWQFSESCPTPNTTPYLYITAPKGSGKTLLGQDVLGLLARNPMPTIGITGPGLFHIVQEMQPTLQIDEVDALYSGAKDESLRMQLNAGYRRGGKVPRVVGGEVQMFSPFCPKILMGIDNGQLPDTVADRAIRIALKRATPEEMATVQPFYSYEVEDEAAELCERIHAWSISVGTEVRDYRPEVMTGVTPRQWEIARSLIQIAHAAGVETEVREALARIYAKHSGHTDSPEQRMLSAIRDLFDSKGTDRLTTVDILAHLEDEGVSIPGNSGKGLSAKLGPFDVRATTIRIGNMTHRGYHKGSFTEAWERYL